MNRINGTTHSRSDKLNSLGLAEVIEAVAARANTPGGKQTIASGQMAPDKEAALRLLDETSAMQTLLVLRPDFDIEPCEEIGDLLIKARKSATLEGGQLRKFIPVLKSGSSLAQLFETDDRALDPIRVDIPTAPGLAEVIDESIDEEGKVRAGATPRIEELYNSISSISRKIRDKAESMLKDPQISSMLQDDFVTLRDNRFVLPIKAEHKSHLDGIVHDSSNSGQTFYIEPKFLVDLNNQLRTAEVELNVEIERLLGDLRSMIAQEADAIDEIYNAICQLDAISARARFCMDHGYIRPQIDGGLKLINTAHPVMLIDGKEAVRNDISIPAGAKALIISGPNTGGKTVALSIIGLCAVLIRIGLFIPADEGSSVPFYQNIFADIGDSQSLQDDLSTFSGHLKTVSEILNNAGAHSLALLDELMINTDPKEGSALALAVVDNLVARGADVVVTTHFHDLKVMAQAQPEYHNVSMEFDALQGVPTFRMITGAPGESSAVAVAEQLQLDPAVITSAKAFLQGSDERIEKAMANLREQKILLERANKNAQSALEEAERKRNEATRTLDDLEAQKAELARMAKRKLTGDITAARRAIAEIMEQAKASKKDQGALKQQLKKLDTITNDVRKAGVPEERISKDKLKAGDTVFVVPLDKKGKLTTDPIGGKVEVALGSVRMNIAVADLIGLESAGPQQLASKTKLPEPTINESGTTAELNIIGYRVDQAIDELERFLDGVARRNEEGCRIVHGKGTGALRSAVHEYLSSSSYVADFHTALQNEGGEGVTLVRFR